MRQKNYRLNKLIKNRRGGGILIQINFVWLEEWIQIHENKKTLYF